MNSINILGIEALIGSPVQVYGHFEGTNTWCLYLGNLMMAAEISFETSLYFYQST
jgi:hypothetical protein